MKYVLLICIFFCLYSIVLSSGSSENQDYQAEKEKDSSDNKDDKGNSDGNDNDGADGNNDGNDNDGADDNNDGNDNDGADDNNDGNDNDGADDNNDGNDNDGADGNNDGTDNDNNDGNDNDNNDGNDNNDDNDNAAEPDDDYSKVPDSNCWMTLNAEQHFAALDEIDERYASIREEIQESLKEIDFDNSMILGFKRERGIALREQYSHHHNTWMIPSGLNLGGSCMVRVASSILFFHRMKLRNNTFFRVNYIQNDLSNMVVRMHLSLNDLHLKGAYERALTQGDPSILNYAPTFGEVEFLMKDVKYKMEGRYRLIKNRLLIELITSEIIVDDIMMTYINKAIESAPKKIEKGTIGSFISKLKTDLDAWLKDYFNDYMIHAEMDGLPHMDELSKYDKEKSTALEEFTDNAIKTIVTRIRLLNAASIQLPTFTLMSVNNLRIKLTEGNLYGLDTMYRRSLATGYKQQGVRKTDCIVGFSNLKVVYKYEAFLPTGVPPLSGVLTLSANELSAHLALAVVVDSETVDLDIEFLDQMKPQSMTVEGAANLMIANFKHLLEHQILAIMSNTLLYGVLMLKSLPQCEPFIPGMITENKAVLKKKTKKEILADIRLYGNSGDYVDPLILVDPSSSEEENIVRSQRPPLTHPMNNSKSFLKKSKRNDKKKNEMKQKKYKRKSKKATSRSKTLPRGKNN